MQGAKKKKSNSKKGYPVKSTSPILDSWPPSSPSLRQTVETHACVYVYVHVFKMHQSWALTLIFSPKSVSWPPPSTSGSSNCQTCTLSSFIEAPGLVWSAAWQPRLALQWVSSGGLHRACHLDVVLIDDACYKCIHESWNTNISMLHTLKFYLWNYIHVYIVSVIGVRCHIIDDCEGC